MNKGEQKKNIIDIMKADEADELYETKEELIAKKFYKNYFNKSDNTMQDVNPMIFHCMEVFAEHYHEIKSKEESGENRKLREKLAFRNSLIHDTEFDLVDQLEAANVRINELEDEPREILKWFINNYNTERMDGSEVDQVLAEYREQLKTK